MYVPILCIEHCYLIDCSRPGKGNTGMERAQLIANISTLAKPHPQRILVAELSTRITRNQSEHSSLSEVVEESDG